ncbi:hypothetical protein CXG81DRAFT_20758 [Caulochytrium protostelioides]|uniref:Cation-transporting P-type ATPase C-terminal domain-containing protein n=1 Tax=Caulochytrium protostelioides TaxID=1555241 RepID=A0A4P9X262_9FUNG|nr:hypothetical protein CXG81DRAFT_20758 [Caulochytrium protostelioides]|eukprot:RKO99118.1 hypothetical protein CXG81DRAFT_20758 [Caulochytrium protostelioides]
MAAISTLGRALQHRHPHATLARNYRKWVRRVRDHGIPLPAGGAAADAADAHHPEAPASSAAAGASAAAAAPFARSHGARDLPFLPSVTSVRVRRDGAVVVFPAVLLVAGDRIELADGEVCPCDVTAIHDPDDPDDPEPPLNGGPAASASSLPRMSTSFKTPPPPPPARETDDDVVYRAGTTLRFASRHPVMAFRVCTTPLVGMIDTVLAAQQHRPPTVLSQQWHGLSSAVFHRLLGIVVLASVVVNLLRWGLFLRFGDDDRRRGRLEDGLEMVAVTTATAAIPLLPIYDVVRMLWQLYGNARITSLVSRLQGAQTQFEDADDIDEFDAAPPPTMHTSVSAGQMLRHVISVWRSDRRQHHIVSLAEALSHVSFLCAIDREGTIANSFPVPKEVFLFNDDGEPTILDVAEDHSARGQLHFEDPDWARALPSLTPLGLGALLAAHAQGTRHRRPGGGSLAAWHALAHPNPAAPLTQHRVTCLCPVARAIGFVPAAAKAYTRHMASDRLVPAALLRPFIQPTWETPPGVAWVTPPAASPMPRVRPEADRDRAVSTPPTVEPLVPSSSSSHTGRAGAAATSPPALASLPSSSSSSPPLPLPRPASSQGAWPFLPGPLPTAAEHAELVEQAVHAQLMTSQRMLASWVYQHHPTQAFHLFSRGASTAVLPVCTDFWAGSRLGTFDMVTRRKLLDYFESARIGDLNVVAWAYRPLVHAATPVAEQPAASMIHTAPPMAAPVLPATSRPGPVAAAAAAATTATATATRPVSPTNELPLSADAVAPAPAPVSPLHELPPPPPRPETSAPADWNQRVSETVASQQTFLGAVGLRYSPRPNVGDFVEDVALAGIRFVYFSRRPERESKAFAERLGLEIDWNSCILLSAQGAGAGGYLEIHDMKARLPRGVETIRAHIRQVDDVPLHVSLFAECDDPSIEEMMRIFQEYGNTTCCMGSPYRMGNSTTFATADVSFALEPIALSPQEDTHIASGRWLHAAPAVGGLPLASQAHPSGSAFALSAAVITMPASFRLLYDTSIFSLTQVLGEARTLAANGTQAMVFLVGAHVTIALSEWLSFALLFPPLFQGYQILWMVWVCVPLMACPLILTAPQPEIMTQMPTKRHQSRPPLRRWLSFYVLRFALAILSTLVVYAVTLEAAIGAVALPPAAAPRAVHWLWGGLDRTRWLAWRPEEQHALRLAQQMAMVALVWYLVVASATFVHRTARLWDAPPFRNTSWACVAPLALVAQIGFFGVSMRHTGLPLHVVPWYAWFLAALLPLVSLPLHEWAKHLDGERWTRFQKRSKLEFNTKLGMHSPI